MNPSDCILFSGGAAGAEAEFGACAERHGIEEVNFTFEGHTIVRHRGVRMLNHEELQAGDVSLAYVSRLMHRRYTDAPTIRRILQTIWYQVNSGQEIYVIGTVLDGRHGARRNRVGRGVRETVQQAALRVRPGTRRVVHVESDSFKRRDTAMCRSSRIRTSPARARARSATTGAQPSRRCSPGRSAPLLDLGPAVEPALDLLLEAALRRLVVRPSFSDGGRHDMSATRLGLVVRVLVALPVFQLLHQLRRRVPQVQWHRLATSLVRVAAPPGCTPRRRRCSSAP